MHSTDCPESFWVRRPNSGLLSSLIEVCVCVRACVRWCNLRRWGGAVEAGDAGAAVIRDEPHCHPRRHAADRDRSVPCTRQQHGAWTGARTGSKWGLNRGNMGPEQGQNEGWTGATEGWTGATWGQNMVKMRAKQGQQGAEQGSHGAEQGSQGGWTGDWGVNSTGA